MTRPQPPRPRSDDDAAPKASADDAAPKASAGEGARAGGASRLPALLGAAGPLVLDPAVADALSKAISAAISLEMERVRTSLVPPGGAERPTPSPAEATSSAAARASIRVAAKATGKGTRYATMAVGVIAFVGQVIVWFTRPELAGPVAQALKLIAWLITAGGGHAPDDPGP